MILQLQIILVNALPSESEKGVNNPGAPGSRRVLASEVMKWLVFLVSRIKKRTGQVAHVRPGSEASSP